MSINIKQNVRCAGCGQLHEVTIWSGITADDSEDLKKELLEGKINMFICPDCGFRAVMSSPLLYEEKSKNLMISFYPDNDKSAQMKMFEQMQENMKNSGELDKYYGYNLRFVADYNSLLEKIIISDNGLWDKAIEVLKLMILTQEPDKADRRICIFGKIENDELEFMVNDTEENQIYISRVPKESYTQIEQELKNSGVKPYSFNWELVDIDYATALINGINNF